jgi:hypothetical protein
LQLLDISKEKAGADKPKGDDVEELAAILLWLLFVSLLPHSNF